MQHLKSISNALAGRTAMVAGFALAADGVLQAVHTEKSAGSRVDGLAGNLNLAFVAIALIAMAPALVALARYGRSGLAQRAGVAAAGGTCLLAVGCLTSIINQHDLSVFPAIAGVANLAWLGGTIVMAVALKRRGLVPTAVAIGLPVTWLFTIPLAAVGGCLVAGGYFLAVGYLLAGEALERVGLRPVVPVLSA